VPTRTTFLERNSRIASLFKRQLLNKKSACQHVMKDFNFTTLFLWLRRKVDLSYWIKRALVNTL